LAQRMKGKEIHNKDMQKMTLAHSASQEELSQKMANKNQETLSFTERMKAYYELQLNQKKAMVSEYDEKLKGKLMQIHLQRKSNLNESLEKLADVSTRARKCEGHMARRRRTCECDDADFMAPPQSRNSVMLGEGVGILTPAPPPPLPDNAPRTTGLPGKVCPCCPDLAFAYYQSVACLASDQEAAQQKKTAVRDVHREDMALRNSAEQHSKRYTPARL